MSDKANTTLGNSRQPTEAASMVKLNLALVAEANFLPRSLCDFAMFGGGSRFGASLTEHDVCECYRRADNDEREYSKEDRYHRTLLTAKYLERILP